MAMICVNHARECEGCMDCYEDVDLMIYDCEWCGKPVYYDDYINGIFLCKECQNIYYDKEKL